MNAPNTPIKKPSIIKKMLESKLHRINILKELSKRLMNDYNFNINDYNIKIINEIIFNQKTHLVSEFKEHLIRDDPTDFLNRFYTRKEFKVKFNKIMSANNGGVILPNYGEVYGRKILKKYWIKKEKIINLNNGSSNSEDDDSFSIKSKSILSNTVLSTNVVNSILNQSKGSFSCIMERYDSNLFKDNEREKTESSEICNYYGSVSNNIEKGSYFISSNKNRTIKSSNIIESKYLLSIDEIRAFDKLISLIDNENTVKKNICLIDSQKNKKPLQTKGFQTKKTIEIEETVMFQQPSNKLFKNVVNKKLPSSKPSDVPKLDLKNLFNDKLFSNKREKLFINNNMLIDNNNHYNKIDSSRPSRNVSASNKNSKETKDKDKNSIIINNINIQNFNLLVDKNKESRNPSANNFKLHHFNSQFKVNSELNSHFSSIHNTDRKQVFNIKSKESRNINNQNLVGKISRTQLNSRNSSTSQDKFKFGLTKEKVKLYDKELFSEKNVILNAKVFSTIQIPSKKEEKIRKDSTKLKLNEIDKINNKYNSRNYNSNNINFNTLNQKNSTGANLTNFTNKTKLKFNNPQKIKQITLEECQPIIVNKTPHQHQLPADNSNTKTLYEHKKEICFLDLKKAEKNLGKRHISANNVNNRYLPNKHLKYKTEYHIENKKLDINMIEQIDKVYSKIIKKKTVN